MSNYPFVDKVYGEKDDPWERIVSFYAPLYALPESEARRLVKEIQEALGDL